MLVLAMSAGVYLFLWIKMDKNLDKNSVDTTVLLVLVQYLFFLYVVSSTWEIQVP